MPNKYSFYNHVFDYKDGRYLIFNALRKSITKVDKVIADAIRNKDLSSIDKETSDLLLKQGVILDSVFNEKDFFRFNYLKSKYNCNVCEYVVLTTYNCNLSCPYCYEGHGNQQKNKDLKGMLNRKVGNRISKFIKKWSLENNAKEIIITLFGGEPLLNYKEGIRILNDIYDWSSKNKIRFKSTMFTNGTLLNQEKISELKKVNFNKPLITFDGSREYHNSKKNFGNKNRGTYDLLLNNLILLKKEKINTIIRINIDKNNINNIEILLDDLIKAKLKESISLSFKPVHELTKKKCNACGFSDREFSRIAPSLWKLAMDKGFEVNNLELYDSFLYCGNAMLSNITIDPFGDLYTCLNFVGDPRHKYGLISTNGEIRFKNSVYYDWMLRDPLSIKECQNCKVLPICAGGCTGQAFYEHGNYHKGHCITEKHILSELINLFVKNKKRKKVIKI